MSGSAGRVRHDPFAGARLGSTVYSDCVTADRQLSHPSRRHLNSCAWQEIRPVLQWLQTRWRLWAAFTPIRMHAARLVKPIPLPPLRLPTLVSAPTQHAVPQMRLILRVGAAREFSWDVQCHRLDSPGALIPRVRGPLLRCLRTAAGWAVRTTPEPSVHLTAEWARWRRLFNGTQSSGCKLRVLDVGTFENR